MSSSGDQTRSPPCRGPAARRDEWRCRDGCARSAVPSGAAQLEAMRGAARPRPCPGTRKLDRGRDRAPSGASRRGRAMSCLSSSPRRTSTAVRPRSPAGAVREGELEPRRLAGPVGQPLPLRHDHRVGVDDVEQLVEHARIAAHVEKAVRLPMAVVQLGDDVAGERAASGASPRSRYLRARNCCHCAAIDEAAQIAEDAVEAPVREAVLDAVGVHDALAPIVAGLEPPGLLALLVAAGPSG